MIIKNQCHSEQLRTIICRSFICWKVIRWWAFIFLISMSMTSPVISRGEPSMPMTSPEISRGARETLSFLISMSMTSPVISRGAREPLLIWSVCLWRHLSYHVVSPYFSDQLVYDVTCHITWWAFIFLLSMSMTSPVISRDEPLLFWSVCPWRHLSYHVVSPYFF